MKRHPRYYEAAAYRISHPNQVELLDFMLKVASSPPRLVERMHADYPGSASWCDHVGTRTFGFADKASAEKFQSQYGGEIVRTK